MMKKRIFISTFIVLFLVSTTGLPIMYHLCNMMNTISFNPCAMCIDGDSYCCKEENYGMKILSGQKDECCKTKLVAEPLSEKYLSVSLEVPKIDFKIFVFTLPFDNSVSEVITKSSCASDNSPPETYSNSLYLNNSVLLI